MTVCTIHTKLDLHVVDTFNAAIRAYFDGMGALGRDSSLFAKTYDLKSAYRQVPVRSDHLKFGYFCIYNHENGQVEVYRSTYLAFWCDSQRLQFLAFGSDDTLYCMSWNSSHHYKFVRRLHPCKQ